MLFVKCRLTARFFHYEWHILLSVRTRKGIPVITFKIQERHAMMYIDNEVLEKMIMTIVEGFDRMEKKLDSMMRVKDCMDGDKLLGFGCMPGIGEECAGRRSANMRLPAAGERKEKS